MSKRVNRMVKFNDKNELESYKPTKYNKGHKHLVVDISSKVSNNTYQKGAFKLTNVKDFKSKKVTIKGDITKLR